MEILDIQPVIQQVTNPRVGARLRLLNRVLGDLRKRELDPDFVQSINISLKRLEKPQAGDLTVSLVARVQKAVLRLVETEAGLVPRNYYRNIWMAFGMAVFGIPFGVLFGLMLHNLSFMAIGLPLGIAFGLAVGKAKDEIARRDGHQIDVELR